MVRIFVTADLHLGHNNIIKYCNRPFTSIKSMNSTLIKNWNRTVGINDIVYFLGDLGYNRGKLSTDYWLNKLNGRIIFIKGNHDSSRNIKFLSRKLLVNRGNIFLLVHNPMDIPKSWKRWSIHGHVHNNDMVKFPFINRKRKTINVSTELTGYRPVEMTRIRRLVESNKPRFKKRNV